MSPLPVQVNMAEAVGSAPGSTVRFGYLRTAEIAPGTYQGGLLITDIEGQPLTFHHTEAITPSRLQQIIYGHSLERYCRVDIVASALLAQLTDPVALIVVSDSFLLHAEKHTTVPVVALYLSEETSFAAHGQYQHVNEHEVLLQASPVGPPIRVAMNQKHRKLQQVNPLLCAMGNYLPPLVPLGRVQLALAEIATETLAKLGRKA